MLPMGRYLSAAVWLKLIALDCIVGGRTFAGRSFLSPSSPRAVSLREQEKRVAWGSLSTAGTLIRPTRPLLRLHAFIVSVTGGGDDDPGCLPAELSDRLPRGHLHARGANADRGGPARGGEGDSAGVLDGDARTVHHRRRGSYGPQVIAFMSQVHFDPDIAAEIFVLEPAASEMDGQLGDLSPAS